MIRLKQPPTFKNKFNRDLISDQAGTFLSKVTTPKPRLGALGSFFPYKTSLKKEFLQSGHADNVYFRPGAHMRQRLSPLGRHLHKQSVVAEQFFPKNSIINH